MDCELYLHAAMALGDPASYLFCSITASLMNFPFATDRQEPAGVAEGGGGCACSVAVRHRPGQAGGGGCHGSCRVPGACFPPSPLQPATGQLPGSPTPTSCQEEGSGRPPSVPTALPTLRRPATSTRIFLLPQCDHTHPSAFTERMLGASRSMHALGADLLSVT